MRLPVWGAQRITTQDPEYIMTAKNIVTTVPPASSPTTSEHGERKARRRVVENDHPELGVLKFRLPRREWIKIQSQREQLLQEFISLQQWCNHNSTRSELTEFRPLLEAVVHAIVPNELETLHEWVQQAKELHQKCQDHLAALVAKQNARQQEAKRSAPEIRRTLQRPSPVQEHRIRQEHEREKETLKQQRLVEELQKNRKLEIACEWSDRLEKRYARKDKQYRRLCAEIGAHGHTLCSRGERLGNKSVVHDPTHAGQTHCPKRDRRRLWDERHNRLERKAQQQISLAACLEKGEMN